MGKDGRKINHTGRAAMGIAASAGIVATWLLSYAACGETTGMYCTCAAMTAGSWACFARKNPYAGLASALVSLIMLVRAWNLILPIRYSVLPMLCFMGTMPFWANVMLCMTNNSRIVNSHGPYEGAASAAQGIAACAACAAILADSMDPVTGAALLSALAVTVPACWMSRRNILTGCAVVAAAISLPVRYGPEYPGVAICAVCASAIAAAGFWRLRKLHAPPDVARELRRMEAEKQAKEERERRGAVRRQNEAVLERQKRIFYGSYFYKATGMRFEEMVDRGKYGEFIAAAAIEKETDANRPDSPFKMLCGVFVPTGNGGNTEADIITIGPGGIRCMEVKNGHGTYLISGTGEGDAVEILPNGTRKTDIGNPLAQNFGHIRALYGYLKKNRLYHAAGSLAGYVVFGPDVREFRFHCRTEEEQDGRIVKQGYCHAGDAGKAVYRQASKNPDVLSRKEVEDVYRLLKPLENNEEERRKHRERHDY